MNTAFSSTHKLLLFILPVCLSACTYSPSHESQHALHQHALQNHVMHWQNDQIYYSIDGVSSDTPDLWRRSDTLDLWRLDKPTGQVHHIQHFVDPDKIGQSLGEPVWFKNHLYFWRTVYGGRRGTELWRTDGTETGTKRIFTTPNTQGEYPNTPQLVEFADRLYIFAMDGGEIPFAVWYTDESAQGQRLLIRRNRDGYFSGFGGRDWASTWSFPYESKPIIIHNGKLMFITYKQNNRNRLHLWSIDPKQPSKVLLLGEFGHMAVQPPNNWNAAPTPLFFKDWDVPWQTDGTVAGTRRVGGNH